MFNLVKMFGSHNSRIIKKYEKVVKKINDLEESISSLSDVDLKKKTTEFKAALASKKTLEDILPEVFAVVRETSKRVLGMRHFDVQLIGGMALHDGSIAEMKTGEGKTLVATLAVYLNALTERGVHVVTVNDYLAKRDANWMGEIYRFLGMEVGVIIGGMSDTQKKNAYNCDIAYGTNHEFGFDYLRDNLKFSEDEMVMRPFNFCVIDEVDSILIDEARTPLIISGVDQGSTQLYISINKIVKEASEGDFEKDEKSRIVTLTDQGVEKIEKGLREIGLLDERGLYDSHNVSLVYHVNCALKAHKIFTKDVDYIVKDGQVMIIDEFTGRIMDGRRYSEGLHQAIEAKEHVEVKTESQTVATISYQNLFRLYPKISGMTGTAMTEEAEFDEIYKLKVVSIPPNKSIVRIDHEDSIFLTMEEKDKAVIKLIKECISRQQPVLVGTASIDRSEFISGLLKEEGIRHNVLNARHHEQEAYIIADAGSPGAVTIATNMAGRGTDIKLGGSWEMRVEIECANISDEAQREIKIKEIKADIETKYKIVSEAGGLFVIGTERNESRRIDNQLRGRSGRQGDQGASKFFLSMEDDLIRRFGSPNFAKTLQRMGVQKDEDLTHRWISKAIEKAQQRVEAYNFDVRKQLLRFDDVMNDQRKVIYDQRKAIMTSNEVSLFVTQMTDEVVEQIVSESAPEGSVPDEWDMDKFMILCKKTFGLIINKEEILENPAVAPELLANMLKEMAEKKYQEKVDKYGVEMMNYVEKDVLLKILDQAWRKHLIALEHLRRGINLRAYAQKNPLNEYKFEAFIFFQNMMHNYKHDALSLIYNFELNLEREPNPSRIIEETNDDIIDIKPSLNIFTSRNNVCSCGSGKKYKHCCGKIEDSSTDFPSVEKITPEPKKYAPKKEAKVIDKKNVKNEKAVSQNSEKDQANIKKSQAISKTSTKTKK